MNSFSNQAENVNNNLDMTQEETELVLLSMDAKALYVAFNNIEAAKMIQEYKRTVCRSCSSCAAYTATPKIPQDEF